MLNIYPSMNQIIDKYRYFFSSGCGISYPTISILPHIDNFPHLYIVQGKFSYFEKLVFNVNTEFTFHISGYGQTGEEALTRLLGETVERWSFLYAKCFLNHLVKRDTYLNLIFSGKKVIPLEYLNVMSQKSVNMLHSYGNTSIYKHYKDDNIDWIPCEPIKSNSEKIYCPSPLLYGQDHSYYPTMSTGTATHTSRSKALENSIIEILQIHTFIKFWYLKKKGKKVNINRSRLKRILNSTIYRKDHGFSLIILDITDEVVQLPTFLTICINNNHSMVPLCAFGIQAGLNIEQSILRSIMECCSVYNCIPFQYLKNQDYFRFLTKDVVKSKLDLDSNFYYWANLSEVDEKLNYIRDLYTSENITIEDLKRKYPMRSSSHLEYLCGIVNRISDYACYQDISYPDMVKRGLYTMRVVIPECLPMCFPSWPFDNHPEFKDTLEIKNDYFPHPLP